MTERREGWWKWLCSCTSGRSHLHCLNDSKWFPSQIRSDNIVHPEFSAFYVDLSCRGGGGGVGWCGLYKTEETDIDPSKGFNACVITCKQLHLLHIGLGWLWQGVVWNRIELGNVLVAWGWLLGGHLSYHLGPTSNIGSAEIQSMQWVKITKQWKVKPFLGKCENVLPVVKS